MAEANVTAAPSEKLAPLKPDRLRVAAFGDSLMWGQGLARDERFARIITDALAVEHEKPPALAVDRSRSGAEIDGDVEQRRRFVDTFPEVFAGPGPQAARFLTGADENPPTRLHGEIPATFPTVSRQVDMVGDALGANIDAALVSGGANDIAFERVVNPNVAGGKFIETFDGEIRRISHDLMLDLIGRVRRKCPNAIILVFGYYAPLSQRSDRALIEAFFKHEHDDDFGWFLNGVFSFVNIGRKIDEAVARSLWAQGRAQHWIRKAVTDANQNADVRGPGVLFVPSGFAAENSVFAETPFIHRDFTHPTKDVVRAEREANCPRAAQLDALRVMRRSLTQGFGTSASVLELRSAVAGPVSLRRLLQKYAQNVSSTTTELELINALDDEISRIQRALIASFLHPNAAGARSYADHAMARYRRHRRVIRTIRKAQIPGNQAAVLQGETMDAQLRRFRLRGAGSVRADVGHFDVDALTVITETSTDSDKNLAPYAWLVITTQEEDKSQGRRVYQLNMRYRFPRETSTGIPRITVRKFYPHLEPGERNRFTIDTEGRLRLQAIVGSRLVLGADPFADDDVFRHDYGTTWQPSRVTLEVNGVLVVDVSPAGTRVGPGDSIDLGYPTEQADFVAPKLVAVAADFV